MDPPRAATRLNVLDARQAQVVECRFFGAMMEAAGELGIGLRTAKRHWAKARN